MFKIKHNTPSRVYKSFIRTSFRTFKAYNSDKDLYKILGVSEGADSKEIKAAYYKLAKLHHPDMNNGRTTELFKDINLAYETLSDTELKKQYDMSRRFSFFKGTSSSSSYQNRSQTSNNSYKADYNDYYYRGQSNYNWKEDPFFKNFNDWFNKSRESSYSSNFSEGTKQYKSRFEKKYYERNKDYFSSFKQGRREEKEHQAKPQSDFAKRHFEKNKKYYESFKKPGSSNTGDYNTNSSDEPRYEQQGVNQNSPGGIFVMMFGCFMGVMLISMIFGSKRETRSIPQTQRRQESESRPVQGYNYSPPKTREEHGLNDDPYARSNKYT